MIAPALLFALLLQAAPVQWAVTAPAAGSAAKAGGKLAVTVTATIAPGWHLYSLKKMEGGPIATTIVLPEGQPFRLAGAIDASAPLSKFDDTFQMDVESYEGGAEFVLPLAVAKDAKPGAAPLAVHARYQVCDDKQCLPPRTVKLELPLEIR
ncbi:MAG: protein-disulfide reductase DsbD N-terminal domain-containing protein [Bryobacterales bacterium]|nr:protein-disulfide reductase DsbD N-terminal domain-containing protein [Bryobacterales bacterium]